MAAKNDGLVNARYVGYPGEFPDGTPAIPGETVRSISKLEAEQSDHWEPVGGPVKDAEGEK